MQQEYMMETVTTAKIVQNVNGVFHVTEIPLERLIPIMIRHGFTFNGFNKNKFQRKELQDQPRFSEFNGPMFDGGKIRYENFNVTQQLVKD